MKSFSRIGGCAALLTVALVGVARADLYSPHPCGATTRTYFGRPGLGPHGSPGGYAPAAGAKNPYTCKLFGMRFCKTPESQQEDYRRRLARAEAKAAAIVNRVQPCSKWGNLASGACGAPCDCAPQGCNNCFLFGCCNKHQGGAGGGYGGPGPGMNPLPGMNREDAVRYMEGMQYYPPNHLLRSPRDFFMFGEKYGLGQ